MKLADIVNRVVIDPRKLTDYALDPDSPWAHHKARVFKGSLGSIKKNYRFISTKCPICLT